MDLWGVSIPRLVRWWRWRPKSRSLGTGLWLCIALSRSSCSSCAGRHGPRLPTEKYNFQEVCEVYFQSVQLFLSSSALKQGSHFRCRLTGPWFLWSGVFSLFFFYCREHLTCPRMSNCPLLSVFTSFKHSCVSDRSEGSAWCLWGCCSFTPLQS